MKMLLLYKYVLLIKNYIAYTHKYIITYDLLMLNIWLLLNKKNIQEKLLFWKKRH